VNVAVRVDATGSLCVSAQRSYQSVSASLPPAQTGPRITSALSKRAARVVSDAAILAVQNGTPLTAFWTFTVEGTDQRRSFATASRPISFEMRRTLNAIRTTKGDFEYVWVAENPRNENPHVHLLTSLVVPRADFDGFAAWVESLWGLGFVHMERLRKPAAAGRYLLKAVGYLNKGGSAGCDMGRVRGSRYAVSRSLRGSAPSRFYLRHVADRDAFARMVGSAPRVLGDGYWSGRSLSFDFDSEHVGDTLLHCGLQPATVADILSVKAARAASSRKGN